MWWSAGSNTGVVMICGQKVALGRIHQHQTITVNVSETSLAIELDDGETRMVYAKLGVKSRRAAVRRAEELALLSRGHNRQA